MIRFIDLFAGTGGMRLAFEQAMRESGQESECVFSSEIDPYAQKTYEANFGEAPVGDIVEHRDDVPSFDFLLAGFPCQPFSAAGKMKGFNDTRGTLFFEIEQILKRHQPSGFLLENVRGLTSHDGGQTFQIILESLQELGYTVQHFFCNSSDFGVPQNRVRIFIVGTRTDRLNLSIMSSLGASDSHAYKRRRTADLFRETVDAMETCTVADILEDDVDLRFWCSEKFTKMLGRAVNNDFERLHGIRMIDYRGGHSLHSWDLGMKGECSTEERRFMSLLIANRRKKKFGTHQDGKRLTKAQIETFFKSDNTSEIIVSLLEMGYISEIEGTYNPVCGNMSFEVFKFLDPESISITLTSSDAHRLGVVQNGKPRRITPREAARLQGYPDSFRFPVEDKYVYKQMGNAVTVPVVKAILVDFFRNNQILHAKATRAA